MFGQVKPKGGWTIAVSESSNSVNIYLTLKLAAINDSKNPRLNLRFLGSTVERQLKLCYECSYKAARMNTIHLNNGLDHFYRNPLVHMTSKLVSVHVDVKYRVISNSHLIASNEHLLVIKDDSYFKQKFGPYFTYGANDIGKTVLFLNEKAVNRIINGSDNNTVPHELGHSLGLYHVDSKNNPHYWSPQKQKLDSTNVMFSGRSRYSNDLYSVGISPEQIDLIIDNYKRGLINNH